MRGAAPHTVALRAGLLCLALLATTCCSNKEGFDADMTAGKVVFRHAEAAFEVFFDAADDRAPLQRFLGATAGSKTRQHLMAAWIAIPELAAQGAGFLDENVFEKAMEDGDWPSDAPELVFVTGTRDALKSFLGDE